MERVFKFDAYGTLFDLASLLPHVEARCPGYGTVITQIWRLKQLEYSWLQSLMGEPFKDFRILTLKALQFALTSAGFMLSANEVEDIASEFMRLRPFPEVHGALRALPARRAILSNGSQSMLDALVSHAGLSDALDFVISVDTARAFKPHPDCYSLVEAVMNVPRQTVVFVSSNGFDVIGAKRFGFTAVWVNRAPPEDSIAPSEYIAALSSVTQSTRATGRDPRPDLLILGLHTYGLSRG